MATRFARPRAGRGCSVATCWAPATPSTWRCGSAPAPMSAARRPRCWKASRAGAARSAPSRRCRRIRACSASPTVINNVLSLAARARSSCARAAAFYRDFGMGRSRGTMPIQLAGNIKHGGLFETAFGVTLRRAGRRHRRRHAVAAGRCARCRSAGRSAPISRVRCSTRRSTTRPSPPRDGLIGHGGIVVFDDTVDMAQQARFAMEFCAVECCGKCTPCRIGSTRGVEVIDRIMAGRGSGGQPRAADAISARRMKFGSLCALGGFTPYPVMSALTHFPEDFAPYASASRQLNRRTRP